MLRLNRKGQRIDIVVLALAKGQHVSLCACLDNSGAGVVHVEHSIFIRLLAVRQMLKEQALGIAVVFHRLVEVQMVLRNIRQHSAVIFNACYALERQCMAGNLHNAVVAACAHHFVQGFLQVNNVRSRVMRIRNLVLNHNVNRAD